LDLSSPTSISSSEFEFFLPLYPHSLFAFRHSAYGEDLVSGLVFQGGFLVLSSLSGFTEKSGRDFFSYAFSGGHFLADSGFSLFGG
jgi:hypothetical protein